MHANIVVQARVIFGVSSRSFWLVTALVAYVWGTVSAPIGGFSGLRTPYITAPIVVSEHNPGL